MSISKVSKDERHNGVDRPSVETPMKIADLDRLGGGGRCAPGTVRWRQKMHYGLSDAVEHHANADARGKQHREPRDIAVSRLCMVGPQLDVPEAR